MKLRMVAVVVIFIIAFVFPALGLERPGVEFKIFQFPKDMVPRIDGKTDDWAMVPDSYGIGTDQLKDTVKNAPVDKNNLDVNVKVGWVKGLNRLYFLYEAYDDYWDFASTDVHNDNFQIVVDGDLSGGNFVDAPGKSRYDAYLFRGLYAQNYHIFAPSEGKSWMMLWGPLWAREFPWSNVAYSYSFKPGESGNLIIECYITPLDYGHQNGPEKAIVSNLEENKIIGLSWACVDFDDVNARDYRAWYNLSHKTSMHRNASDLVAFRLMPLEKQYHKPIEAQWSFKIVDIDRSLVAFKDLSYGNITSWKWDFGDDTTSTEQNPIHRYAKPGINYTVVLYVEGPDGKARMAKPWVVAVRGDAVKTK